MAARRMVVRRAMQTVATGRTQSPRDCGRTPPFGLLGAVTLPTGALKAATEISRIVVLVS